MPFPVQWLNETWNTLAEAAPWLLGGFVAAGVIHVLLPQAKMVAHLGKPGLGAVIKASLVGVPLPLCSCSVIPVASSIRKQGAGRGATASFLISTPETGVDSIALSYALLGPFFAVARPVVALVTALFAGAAIDRFILDPEPASSDETPPEGPRQAGDCDSDASSCCCHTTSAPEAAQPALGEKARTAARYGLIDMFADLSHWLLLGFALAGLVGVLFPADFLEAHIGTGLGAMLLMAVIGLPVYVCATASTPVAAALIAKGLSPGAALVFLLVGPATNIATMLIVGKDLGRKSLALYLTCIFVVAILAGLGADALLGGTIALPTAHAGHEHAVPIYAHVAAGLLALLMLNGLRLRYLRHRAARRGRKADACCHNDAPATVPLNITNP